MIIVSFVHLISLFCTFARPAHIGKCVPFWFFSPKMTHNKWDAARQADGNIPQILISRFSCFLLKAKSQDVSMVSVGVPWAVPVSHPQNLLERAANLQKGGSLTMLGLSGAGRAIGLSSSWGYALDEIHHIWRCSVLNPRWTRWWFYVFCCFLLGTVVIWEWVAPIPPDKGAEECGPGCQGKISKWTEFHSLWWLLSPR